MASDALDSGFRHILDAITDGVYVTSADREIVYWSAGAEDAGRRVTTSAGGPPVALGDEDERSALARADQAMYAAKHSGRDGFSVTAGEKRG